VVLLPRFRRLDSAWALAYRRAEPPAPDTPWREAPYAVVDLETTGLNPRRDEIISFASVPIDDGRIVVGGMRTVMIRPERMPEAETIRIHGLRPVDLDGARPLSEAIDVILRSLTGRVLVAHAAWVERGFLNRALKIARLRVAEPILDTSALAQRVLPGVDPDQQGVQLGAAARALGLPTHRPHRADGDALTTAQLFLALVARLDEVEPQTVESLGRLSQA
jgi:DNA polymerase-3 subunit epsilon